MEENNKEEFDPVDEAIFTSTTEDESDTDKADANVNDDSGEEQKSAAREEWWIEKHSIYDYLKEHPSALVAIASGVIAIASFCIKFVSYNANAQIVKYWGFPTEILSLAPSNFTYTVGIAIIFIITVAVIEMTIASIVNSFLERNLFWRYARLTWQIRRADFKKRTKMLRKAKKAVHQLESKQRICASSEDNVDLEEQKRIVREYESAVEEAKHILDEKEDEDKPFVKERAKVISFAVIGFAISFLLLFTDAFLIFSNYKEALMYALLLIVINLPTVVGLLRKKDRPRISRRIVKKHITDGVETEKWKEYANRTMTYLKGNRFYKTGFANAFPNNYPCVLAISIACTLLLLLFISTIPIPSSLYLKARKAELVKLDETAYFVAFKQNNVFYLDEAEIFNDNLYVKTYKQRYLVSDDVAIEIKQFSNVYKIETENAFSIIKEGDDNNLSETGDDKHE